jgi:hypothetical protein
VAGILGEMPFTVASMIIRFVLSLVAVLICGDVSKEVELLVLRHENAVLRRRSRALGTNQLIDSGSRR